MDFLGSLIFVIVSMLVACYFGVQFMNSIKIHNYLSLVDNNEESSITALKEIDKLYFMNTAVYVFTHVALTALFFIITKTVQVHIVGVCSILIVCLSLIYSNIKHDNKGYDVYKYKVYSLANMLVHIALLILPISFMLMVLVTI